MVYSLFSDYPIDIDRQATRFIENVSCVGRGLASGNQSDDLTTAKTAPKQYSTGIAFFIQLVIAECFILLRGDQRSTIP